MQSNKKNIIEVFLIAFIMLLFVAIFIFTFLPKQKLKIINGFHENKQDMEIMVFELNFALQGDAYIEKDMSWTNAIHNRLNKEKVQSFLENQGYLYIEKNADCIFFCQEAHFGKGLGVAYAKKGMPKSNYGDMVCVEKIEECWFYCEID